MVEIEGTKLTGGDAVMLSEIEFFQIDASEDSGIILFDVTLDF